MRRLKAILRILFADKWAVFTFEEAAPDPTWLKVPNFFWNISHKDKVFFWYIKERLRYIEENIETYTLDNLIRMK